MFRISAFGLAHLLSDSLRDELTVSWQTVDELASFVLVKKCSLLAYDWGEHLHSISLGMIRSWQRWGVADQGWGVAIFWNEAQFIIKEAKLTKGESQLIRNMVQLIRNEALLIRGVALL